MNKLRGLGCLVLVVVGALPACGGGGDDDEKKGTPYSSGLSGKPLSQLTDAEMNNICGSVGWYFTEDPNFISATCRFAGVGIAAASTILGPRPDAELQATCTQIESACLEADGQATQEPGTCQKPGATCTATVAELEACVTDTRDAVSAALLSLPACNVLKGSDFGTPTAGGPTTNVLPTPESCKTLEQKCPGAAEGARIPDPTATDGPSGQ